MDYPYADQAKKSLYDAIPTTNSDGNVVKWELTIGYELNDYAATYISDVYIEKSDRKPEQFSADELMALAPSNDAMFDGQYASVMVPLPPEEVLVRQTEFDSEDLIGAIKGERQARLDAEKAKQDVALEEAPLAVTEAGVVEDANP